MTRGDHSFSVEKLGLTQKRLNCHVHQNNQIRLTKRELLIFLFNQNYSLWVATELFDNFTLLFLLLMDNKHFSYNSNWTMRLWVPIFITILQVAIHMGDLPDFPTPFHPTGSLPHVVRLVFCTISRN